MHRRLIWVSMARVIMVIDEKCYGRYLRVGGGR